MAIKKTCARCGVEFSVPPSREKTAKYCSKICYDKAQQTREYRDIECESCGKPFNTAQDHGVWPKFCSRECFLSGCLRSESRTCPVCKKEFTSIRSTSTGELKIFCSTKCRGEADKVRVNVPCSNCGSNVELTPSAAKQRSHAFCSKGCRSDFMRDERAPRWRGGSYIASWSGHKMIATENGFVSEHRLVAAEILDRPLKHFDEPIIHLNGIQNDNNPKNLYIFESMEEMGLALHRESMPVKSNLSPLTYQSNKSPVNSGE